VRCRLSDADWSNRTFAKDRQFTLRGRIEKPFSDPPEQGDPALVPNCANM